MKTQNTIQNNWTHKSVAAIAGASMAAVALAGAGLTSSEASEPTASASDSASASDRFGGPNNRIAGAENLPDGRYLPVHDYRVSAGWGHSSGPHAGREHGGIDFAADMNEPVYAVDKGKVVSAGYNGGYGQMVKIKHPDGHYTVYAHLNKINVKKGQQVEAGKRIGAVGSTGYSTGPHLHFEARSAKDRPIKPTTYLGVDSKELRQLTKSLRQQG